ncbi:hypothetical protein SLEP1_g9093 [Rubroshorea leprosula]|uniref:Uncharacterized protein n=1 Tax=Rubroshorea leprosula TaxID=152421 RepID=A0AAV5ID05_9ROSI|nr:hypothetical protein SLEP1_g9093 [Rubroshorea leprosula]
MEERRELTLEEEQTQEEKSFIDMEVIKEEIKRVQTKEGERTAEGERHKSEEVIEKNKERRGLVDFVSATDPKRMVRERRGLMDFRKLSSQSNLSRYVSLNHRVQYSSPNAGLKTKVKIQPLQPNGKKQEKQQGNEEKENSNLVTQPKSPVLGRQSKPASKAESIKTGDKAKGLSSKTITSSAKEKINNIFKSTE